MLRNAHEICMYFERMRIDGLLLAFTFANPCKYMRCRKNSLAHVTCPARNRCMKGAFKSLKFFFKCESFFKIRENTEAATPHFFGARPNRNQAPGPFCGRGQCARVLQYTQWGNAVPALGRVGLIFHIARFQMDRLLSLPAQCQWNHHCSCFCRDSWIHRHAKRVGRS